MVYYLEIDATRPFDERIEILEWVKTNCPSYTTNFPIYDPLTSDWKYAFSFYDEKDYIWATLKWAN